MHTVYVLRSRKDGNPYIGCTSDPTARIQEHEAGRVSSTKSRRPLILVYHETYQDKYEAFRMEREYKSPSGKKELKSKIENSGIV